MTANVANDHHSQPEGRGGRPQGGAARRTRKYGKIAKLRSTHNNYLTLPVIFLMLSNHYPLAFASDWNWADCEPRLPEWGSRSGISSTPCMRAAATGGGPGARRRRSSRRSSIFSILPLMRQDAQAGGRRPQPERGTLRRPWRPFRTWRRLVLGNCNYCHAAENIYYCQPYPRLAAAPLAAVILDTDAAIATHANGHLPSGRRQPRHPPGGVAELWEEDRALIRDLVP